MKHSRAFINYLGYRVLFWESILTHDGEKSGYYMNEMNNNLHELNIDELLELLNYMSIMDNVYMNRQ